MKIGQLFNVNGVRFVYGGVAYSKFKCVNLHKLCEIGVDDYGKVFATDNVWYFTDEELSEANKFNPLHWQSLIEFIIGRKYPNLTEMQIRDATFYVFDMFVAYGIPKMHELEDYITASINR